MKKYLEDMKLHELEELISSDTSFKNWIEDRASEQETVYTQDILHPMQDSLSDYSYGAYMYSYASVNPSRIGEFIKGAIESNADFGTFDSSDFKEFNLNKMQEKYEFLTHDIEAYTVEYERLQKELEDECNELLECLMNLFKRILELEYWADSHLAVFLSDNLEYSDNNLYYDFEEKRVAYDKVVYI